MKGQISIFNSSVGLCWRRGLSLSPQSVKSDKLNWKTAEKSANRHRRTEMQRYASWLSNVSDGLEDPVTSKVEWGIDARDCDSSCRPKSMASCLWNADPNGRSMYLCQSLFSFWWFLFSTQIKYQFVSGDTGVGRDSTFSSETIARFVLVEIFWYNIKGIIALSDTIIMQSVQKGPF